MSRYFRALPVSVVIGLTALAFVALPVSAAPIVANGSFENIGTQTSSFAIEEPPFLPDWSDDAAGYTGTALFDCLVVPTASNVCGSTGVQGDTNFWVSPGPSPNGGNFFASDGDSRFNMPLTQTLTLPSPGTYTVSFYQAAAQLQPLTGATTEQWQVCLGTECQDSTLMSNASHGDVPWMSQSLTFTAPSTTEVLSFLAMGSIGLPPFVLLDGVSVDQGGTLPEPAAVTLVGIGLLAIPIARRVLRHRRA